MGTRHGPPFLVGRTDIASFSSSPPLGNSKKLNESGMTGHSYDRKSSIAVQGQPKRDSYHACQVQCNVNVSAKTAKKQCLVDRGANGCIIGADMTVIERTSKFIDLTGIEDHTVRELNIVHAACVAKTHRGHVILHLSLIHI